MPLENPYCTVDQVRSEIRNATADATILENAINAASRYIDEYKRSDFFFHDHSETPMEVDAADRAVIGNTLWLPVSPIITLTRVVASGDEWQPGVNYIAKGNRLVAIDGDWPIGLAASEHTLIYGLFGYDQRVVPEGGGEAELDSTSVPKRLPKNIESACILIAAAFSGLNVKDAIGWDGNKTQLVQKDIPQSALDMLGKRPAIL